MNKIIQKLGLLPADRIVIPKSQFRIVKHHALYIGKNHQGEDLIIENKIGVGVRVITATKFFKDVIEISRIEKFTGSNYERKLAVQKALSKVGLPYNLIDYNCQHFANDIQYGRVESDQATNGVVGFAALLFLGLFLID